MMIMPFLLYYIDLSLFYTWRYLSFFKPSHLVLLNKTTQETRSLSGNGSFCACGVVVFCGDSHLIVEISMFQQLNI